MAECGHICIVCGREFLAPRQVEPVCSQQCSDAMHPADNDGGASSGREGLSDGRITGV